MTKKKTFLTFITIFCVAASLLTSLTQTARADDVESVSYQAKWVGDEIQLTVHADKAGTAYYAVQESGSASPSSDAVVSSGNTVACAAGEDAVETITPAGTTAKDLYIVYKTADSTYSMSKLELPAKTVSSVAVSGDATPLGTVQFTGVRNGASSLSLTVTPGISGQGQLYYIVKDAGASVPSDADFANASMIQEEGGVSKTFVISLDPNGADAKSVYLRYYVTSSGTLVQGTTVLSVPAYDSSIFSAEISSTTVDFGNPLEGYDASALSQTLTITNTGSGTLTFVTDTSDSGYANFRNYFNISTSGAASIPAGESGSVTISPKTGLAAGTYTASVYLIDQIDASNALRLGPINVTIQVAEKGDGTVEGVRKPTGEYTPTSNTMALSVKSLEIDGRVAYCANYYYLLYNDSYMGTRYDDKYGVIPDATAKELDSYTGLDPNANPVVYPPNNYNYVPVKAGSSSSEVRDNVARVLYYGYPNDAAGLLSEGNYQFWNLIERRKEAVFMIATQCAIRHYTDGIDFTDIHNPFSNDSRVQHIQAIYGDVTTWNLWGWSDVENLYEILIGSDYIYQPDRVNLDTSTLTDAPSDFAVDLFVADNPIYGTWTQNLVASRVKEVSQEYTDVTITKIWNDSSNSGSVRPGAEQYKSWIRLYRGSTDVTDTYAGNLTVTDNDNNTYTVTYANLPVSEDAYTIREVIPDAYQDVYKIPEDKASASSGGTLTNTLVSEQEKNASLVISKVDNRGQKLDGAVFTLYADAACTQAIATLTPVDGTVSLSTSAPYMASYLPAENNATRTVYLKETTAPTGYELISEPYEITLGTVIEQGWNAAETAYTVLTSHTIAYNHNAALTVVNQPTTAEAIQYDSLTVEKSNTEGEPLEGAVFTLYESDGVTPVTLNGANVTYTTDADSGKATISTSDAALQGYLPAVGSTATLCLKETDAPEGYEVNSSVYTLTLGAKNTTEWNSDHTALVTTTIDTITCEDSPLIKVTDIMTDQIKIPGTLKVYKSDAVSGNLLAGAEFTIYQGTLDADGTVTLGDAVESRATNSEGYAQFKTTDAEIVEKILSQLSVGEGEQEEVDLFLQETDAPQGYQVNEEIIRLKLTRKIENDVTTDSLTVQETGQPYITVSDQPETASSSKESELTVYKVNESEQPLEGAVFTLYSDSGCTNAIQELSTDESGVLAVSTGADYLAGILSTEDEGIVYVYLKETSAPTNYRASDAAYEIKIQTFIDSQWNSDHTAMETITTHTISHEGGEAITVVNYATTSLVVHKRWADIPADSQSPVTVQLTRDGTPVEGMTATLSAPDWTASFEDLDKFSASGMEYWYSVVEIGAELYDVFYHRNADGSITVTNAPNSAKTSLTVTKTWDDGASGTTAFIELYRNNEPTGRVMILTEADGWTGTFDDLPKYDTEGQAFEYSVKEIAENYVHAESTVQNEDGTFTASVVNSPSTEKVEITVRKKWDGVTGKQAVIHLLADGVEVSGGRVVLTASNNWTHSFGELDKYAADGHAIEYTVEEDTMNGYTIAYSGSAETGFVVTNKSKPFVDTSDAKMVWPYVAAAMLAGAILLLEEKKKAE